MSAIRPSRLPPAGAPIPPGLALRALARPEPERALADALVRWLGVERVELFASGREALRAAFAELAARSGRSEVVVPSYTCFSVAAAAVAAGCRVRLVDVDERGWIDREDLARQPLERAAAVLVSNLFGVGEPLGPVARLAEAAGAAVIDDAAQSLGAETAEGIVGARADWSLLSFARGKPLAALGGGALVGRGAFPSAASAVDEPSALRGLFRVLVYDAALSGLAFRVLAAIPALHIGETPFDPGFERGAIEGDAAALAAGLVARAPAAAEARRREAEALASRVEAVAGWSALRAPEGERAVHPRLALRAPSARARDAALRALTRLGAGASPFYPSALDAVPGLRPHLAEPRATPGGRRLAERILTLPSHGRLRGRRLEQALRVLAEASGA